MFDILFVAVSMSIITTIFFAKEIKPPVERPIQCDNDGYESPGEWYRKNDPDDENAPETIRYIINTYKSLGHQLILKINTNKQTIKFFIDDFQYCCEDYGIEFKSDYDLGHFSGAILQDIKQSSSSNYDKKSCKSRNSREYKVKTDKGNFSIIIFNNHKIHHYIHNYEVKGYGLDIKGKL